MIVGVVMFLDWVTLIQSLAKRRSEEIEKPLRISRSHRKRRMEVVDECLPLEGKGSLHLVRDSQRWIEDYDNVSVPVLSPAVPDKVFIALLVVFSFSAGSQRLGFVDVVTLLPSK